MGGKPLSAGTTPSTLWEERGWEPNTEAPALPVGTRTLPTGGKPLFGGTTPSTLWWERGWEPKPERPSLPT